MSWLSDAYTWIDANIMGGVLPGGHEVTAPGATIGGVIPTPFYGVQPANGAAPGAPAGGMFGAGAAVTAAQGMPTTFPGRPSAPRGRSVTATATVYPDGSILPQRMVPGRVIVTTEDLQTVKRVKKAKRLLDRAFPAPRKKTRRYCAPRRSTKSRK